MCVQARGGGFKHYCLNKIGPSYTTGGHPGEKGLKHCIEGVKNESHSRHTFPNILFSKTNLFKFHNIKNMSLFCFNFLKLLNTYTRKLYSLLRKKSCFQGIGKVIDKN